jgi:hypothetical protein
LADVGQLERQQPRTLAKDSAIRVRRAIFGGCRPSWTPTVAICSGGQRKHNTIIIFLAAVGNLKRNQPQSLAKDSAN